jgi:hypothetical protein
MDLNPPNTEGVVSDQGLESWEEAPLSHKLTPPTGSDGTTDDASAPSIHPTV